MKYIAIFDDSMLSNFRLDDGGLTLVMTDKKGFNRAVSLKPVIRPTLTPYEERPHGGWIEENSETGAIGIKYTWVRCNQCGWNNSLVIPKNFCPNCGADMRGEEDANT